MKNIKNLFAKNNYLQIIFFWIPLTCVFITVTTTPYDFWAFQFLYSYIISFVTATFVYLLSWIYPLNRFSSAVKVVFQFVIAVPGIALGYMLANFAFTHMKHQTTPLGFREIGVSFLYMGFILLMIALFEKHRKTVQLKYESELREKEIVNQVLQAQIGSLSNQLSPHFLFNALNTLVSIIHIDPSLAERMVLKIADLYRGIVVSTSQMEHSLQAELSICEAYLEIERIRFGERLSFHFQNELKHPLDRYTVPVLLIQPLLENAVKYGISPSVNGGKIQVTFKEDGTQFYLSVENLITSQHPGSGTQTGLLNLKKRIELIYAEKAQIVSEFETQKASVRIQIQRDQVLCEDYS